MKGNTLYLQKHDKYSSHAKIASEIRNLSRVSQVKPYAVLDIGCAAGFLREFLPATDYVLVGIEGDESLAYQARQTYDDVHLADLNHPLSLALQPPDVVVLGDILEHLSDPETVLTDLLKQFIKPGTPIIISLPNIAHLYIRISLMLGRFNYADRGILDRTHLRFFTLKTAKQLCSNCGVRLQSVDTTPIPLPLLHLSFAKGGILYPLHSLSALLASMFKGLLGYQFILRGVYEP